MKITHKPLGLSYPQKHQFRAALGQGASLQTLKNASGLSTSLISLNLLFQVFLKTSVHITSQIPVPNLPNLCARQKGNTANPIFQVGGKEKCCIEKLVGNMEYHYKNKLK